MQKITKAATLIIFLYSLFVSSGVVAQDKNKKQEVNKRESVRRRMHYRDSLLRSFSRSDTSINSLVQRLEHYTTTFNQINNSLADGIDTAEIAQGFPPALKRINKIDSLTNTHKSSTLRYLFVLRDNLDHLQDKLEGWQSDLEDISSKLVQNQNELIKFAKDTSLRIIPSDSLVREAFFAHRGVVRHLFRATDSVNRGNLLKVNLLQDKVSAAYTKILDETDQIDSKIKRFAIKAVNGESDYIWNTGFQFDDFRSALKGTVRLNKILFNYFIKSETPTHAVGFIFLIFLLGWVMFVRTKTLRRHESPQTILDQANYISRNPVISALLVAAAIIPYFYSHPPVVFLETFFLATMILTLVLLKKNFGSSSFKFMHSLFWLTVIYGLSNLFIQISNIDRYAVLALSIASLVLAGQFYKNVKAAPGDYLTNTALALKIFIGLQFFSIALNITGRFSLAKIIGITAVFNLWFLVILFFVVQIISQGLFLQFQVKKDGNSILNWVDYTIVQKKFRNVLIMLASLIWLFFLLQNLNIDDFVSDNISELLSQSRSVGGASFTFGGFVIFIAVIWISSIVSRIISYFYDISAQRVNDLSVAKKKNRTSTLLIRLGVFSIGFLLAVAASGFPLEKLTIIISAFGIGIGFGLQNIVNNLVSGLILAFEKPIQIGDIIEVDNRSGTMKEIGIRSSKILTSEGSEVIIPNGDLISRHVVNWTLSNSNRRIELPVIVAYGEDIDRIKTLLKNLLQNHDDVMRNPAPSVFLNSISESAVEFKVFFWADDISTTLELKSRVITDIHKKFTAEGVRIPSAQKDIYLHFPDGAPGFGAGEKNDEKTVPDTNKTDPGQAQ